MQTEPKLSERIDPSLENYLNASHGAAKKKVSISLRRVTGLRRTSVTAPLLKVSLSNFCLHEPRLGFRVDLRSEADSP